MIEGGFTPYPVPDKVRVPENLGINIVRTLTKCVAYHGIVYENATVIKKHILYTSRRVNSGASTTLNASAIGIV